MPNQGGALERRPRVLGYADAHKGFTAGPPCAELTFCHFTDDSGLFTAFGASFRIVPEAGSRDGAVEVPACSLGSIARRLGHARIDLLKMDIDGVKYEVLDTLLDSAVKSRQLLVEFHHRFAGIGPDRTVDTVARLRNDGYRIFAISETGREFSLMRSQEP